MAAAKLIKKKDKTTKLNCLGFSKTEPEGEEEGKREELKRRLWLFKVEGERTHRVHQAKRFWKAVSTFVQK